MTTNVDPGEIARFDKIAAQWWDTRGEMAPLHVINPVRTRYIEQAAGGLKGKRALDVGCGGGILSEALALRGAQVLGIDLAGEVLQAARLHLESSGLNVEYREVSAEALAAEQPESFDLVTCLEMLEHVPDPAAIVQACAKLVRRGGTVVFSTINRNPKSYALAILGAEYLLNLIPRGTHDYAKLIRPSELDRWARAAGLEVVEIRGLQYNPLLKSARLSADVDVNYLMHCKKTGLGTRDSGLGTREKHVNSPSPVRCILFDLDGTLVDTAPDLAFAANAVRAEAGLPPLPLANYRPVASAGARGLLKVALDFAPEHPEYPRCRDRFLEIYRDKLSLHSRLFPEMDETLAAFEKRNIRWGVVTNKPQWLAQPLMQDLGLMTRMACLVGQRDGLAIKPAPDSLLLACAELKLKPAECVYVGDDRRDVQAARAAAMPVLAAAWGYIGADEAIEDWRADAVVSTPAELLKHC